MACFLLVKFSLDNIRIELLYYIYNFKLKYIRAKFDSGETTRVIDGLPSIISNRQVKRKPDMLVSEDYDNWS